MGLPPRCEPLLRDGLFRLVHGLRNPRLEAGGGLPVEDALADGDVELGDGVRKEAADFFGLGLRRPAEILHDVADLGDDGAVAGPAAVALRGALLGLLGVRHVGSVTPFSGCSSAGVAAEGLEALACALGLVGAGELVDDEVQLDHGLRLLAEFEMGDALLEVRCRGLVALRIRAKQLVERGDRLARLLLRRPAFAGPVEGVVGEIGARELLGVVLETLPREIVSAALVVGRGLREEVRRRDASATRRRGNRRETGAASARRGAGSRGRLRGRRGCRRDDHRPSGRVPLSLGDLLGELREAPIRVFELPGEGLHLARQVVELRAQIGVRAQERLCLFGEGLAQLRDLLLGGRLLRDDVDFLLDRREVLVKAVDVAYADTTGHRREKSRGQDETAGSRSALAGHFAVTTKWARRFFCHESSSCPVAKGRSLPYDTVLMRLASTPSEVR